MTLGASSVGERPERRDAQTAEQVDQLGAAEHREREGGEEPRRRARRDDRARARGQRGAEDPVGHPDAPTASGPGSGPVACASAWVATSRTVEHSAASPPK